MRGTPRSKPGRFGGPECHFAGNEKVTLRGVTFRGVGTTTARYGDRTNRVLALIASRPWQTFSPYAIHRALADVTLVNARQLLKRAFDRGLIRRVSRGLYQDPSSFVRDVSINPTIAVHNLHLLAECHKLTPRGYRRLKTLVTQRFATPGQLVNPRNKALVLPGHDWEGRNVTIQLTTRRNLLVSVKASYLPLTWLELHSLLTGWLPGSFDLPLALWRVTEADFNIDEGGRPVRYHLAHTAISVTEFAGVLLQFYAKAVDRWRTEATVSKRGQVERFVEYARDILGAVAELYGEAGT